MARVLLITIFLLSLSSGLTQAATQEAECYGGQLENADEGFRRFTNYIYQGGFRGLSFPMDPPDTFQEGQWANFTAGAEADYTKWGVCVYAASDPQGNPLAYNRCGDASIKTQLCWSEAPFTLANTNGGETCVSTMSATGKQVERGQTFYAISIDRSGAETKYCQIEFKTLDDGVQIPRIAPGTGSTRVVGLAGGDSETDQKPDGPTTEFPFDWVFISTAVPFMPHFLLIGMTVMLATLGLRRARRRNAA